MKIRIFCLFVLFIPLEAIAWEVKFPGEPGKSEIRITIKPIDDSGWVKCTATITGGVPETRAAKLVGRRDTPGEYLFSDKKVKDVKAGDYYFMAGGTVYGKGQITAKLRCGR